MTGADLQYDQHSSEEELEVGIFEIHPKVWIVSSKRPWPAEYIAG